MARINRLAARQIDSKQPGFYADGGNLYLQVRPSGSRAWVFQYKRGSGDDAKPRKIGLGSTASRSLAQARQLATTMRTILADGGDPGSALAVRRGEEHKTFKAYAAEVVAAKQIGWKSAKHGKQWLATLEQYAYPTIGKKRPRDIMLADVKAILSQKDMRGKQLWATKTETASRLRQRIETVIDYAAVHEGDDRRNPARWKGNLDHAGFQSPRAVTAVKHHAALQYDKVPELMAELRKRDSTSTYCLRWTILAAARSGESRGTRWDEIDEGTKTWSVPPKE